jgi:predicted ATPase/DNA-binding CsgD family transcriptional regulator
MTKTSPRHGVGGAFAMTSFVGRRRELSEAKMRMTESRLVTLTGPGGVGKTRLAFELADRSRKAFRDGVWVVELASLEEEASLASTVLSALSVPDQSTRSAVEKLVEYLRERQILVVMDNCEHLLQASAGLAAELLQQAPGLRVLATSREPLGIAGERICLIPPLVTPSPFESHTVTGLHQYEAVNLLIDRARGMVADFAVTAENSEAVVQLCNRLDGMPLAIELAAARLRSLSVTQIVERLDRRFQLLTGGDRAGLPRQRTLRALIDWSCELCTPAERLLWARLSVFPGSFDLESAENVCGFGDLDPIQILDLLDRLVAKSVVSTERSGEQIRYRQLMTMREYGAELLAGHDDGYPTLKRRQRDHYLKRTADMVANWCGPGQTEALWSMRNDHANLLSALEWSVNTPGELRSAAELASLLRYHWIAGGFLSDGRRWLDRILEQSDQPSPERGAAFWVAAWVSLVQGDRDTAARYLNECREAASVLNDPVLAAQASHWQGFYLFFTGNLSESIDLYESAIAAHKKTGDTASALTGLFELALAQVYSGDTDQALRTCEESLELSSRRGERWGHAYSLWILALCRLRMGDNAQARKAAMEALEIQREFKDAMCTALTIELLSWIAASESRFETAAELANAASDIWTGLGTKLEALGPHLQADSVHSAETIRNHVSPRRMAELLAQQPRLTKEEAIAKALGVKSSAASPEAAKSPLTPREGEIARFVAEGLSNRSIAEILVISPRTVEGHVENILNKLGFAARAQLAVWVAQQTIPPAS